MGVVSDAVLRHFRPFSSSSPGLSGGTGRESQHGDPSGAMAVGVHRTLCLIIINLAMQAGGPLSRTGFPVREGKRDRWSSDKSPEARILDDGNVRSETRIMVDSWMLRSSSPVDNHERTRQSTTAKGTDSHHTSMKFM